VKEIKVDIGASVDEDLHLLNSESGTENHRDW